MPRKNENMPGILSQASQRSVFWWSSKMEQWF